MMWFRRPWLCFAVVLCVGGMVLAVPAPGQWPMLGGGPEHQGVADSGPDDLDTILWVTPLSVPGGPQRRVVAQSGLVVSQGTLYAFAHPQLVVGNEYA